MTTNPIPILDTAIQNMLTQVGGVIQTHEIGTALALELQLMGYALSPGVDTGLSPTTAAVIELHEVFKTL